MEREAPEDRNRELTRQPEPVSSDMNGGPANSANVISVTYWTSDEIFKGLREVVILHNGAEYGLRITASDKLILTK